MDIYDALQSCLKYNCFMSRRSFFHAPQYTCITLWNGKRRKEHRTGGTRSATCWPYMLQILSELFFMKCYIMYTIRTSMYVMCSFLATNEKQHSMESMPLVVN